MFVAALLILGLALAVLLTTRDAAPPAIVTLAPAPILPADGLTSDDEGEVLAAIDATTARGGRLPALLLYHPSPVVVKRTLATMTGRDVTPYLLARKLGVTRPTHARW
jgi:hypothetical protein